MRVMIAGGGTGGHVYPGIAIYNALRRSTDNVEVLFVGAKAGVEAHIFDDLGLPHVLLAGRGVRGTTLLSKLKSPFVILSGVVRGIRIIADFRPNVVIGTGGYASVAVVVASILMRKKRVLQEQNSVPGLANRLLSRFAHLVLLSFAESRAFFGGGVPCAVVGNPLRIRPVTDREEAMRVFQLRSELPTVLVFGGSRGARSINRAASAAVKRILEDREIQFVMLTGQSDYEEVQADLASFRTLVRVLPFLEEIQHAYSAADLAIARSGASSVFELAAFGVPSIFVPYPFAADDHQKKNVAELERVGGAVVMDNDEVSGETLEAIILTLLDDEDRRRRLSERIRAWSAADADARAAERIIDLAKMEHAETVTAAVGVEH